MGSSAVRVLRAGLVESVHEVHVAVADAGGRLVAAAGDPSFATFARSSAKPFQAIAVLESGAAEKFGFTDEDLAVVAGSHSGEKEHVAIVERILDRAGLPATALGCGTHAPYDRRTAEATRGAWTPLQHNCSGKHAGMLAAAVALGAPTDSYLSPSHPVQRLVLATVAEFSGVPEARIGVAVDGCGVPSFRLPLAATAAAFARLARPDAMGGARADAARRVGRAMVAHPYLVAGHERFDTALMDAADGRLLAKAGAEAFQAVADLETGLGLALKVADGSSRAVAPAAIETTRQLGWLEARALEVLGDLWRPAVTNAAGRDVGRIEPEIRLDRV